MKTGPLALILSGLSLGASGVIIKALSENLGGLEISFFRFIFAFLIATIFCLLLREALILKDISRNMLLLYATIFPLSVVMFTLSVSYGTVALALTAAFATNILTSFAIGKIALQEPLYREKVIAAILVLMALGFLLFGKGEAALSLGFLFGVICGVAQGIANYSQKRLGQEKADKSSLLLLQTFSGTLLIGAPLLLLSGAGFITQMDQVDWLLALLSGFIFVLIVALFAFGFRHTSLNTASVLISSQLFFAPLLSFIFLGEAITFSIAAAIVLIFVAVVLVNLKDGFFNRGSIQE